MAEAYYRAVLREAVGRVCQVIGWQVVHGSALDVMVDLLQRYMHRMGTLSKQYSELDGRPESDFSDLSMMMESLGISLSDLKVFVQEVDSLAPDHVIFDAVQSTTLKHFRIPAARGLHELDNNSPVVNNRDEPMDDGESIESDESDEMLQCLPPMISRTNTDTIVDDGFATMMPMAEETPGAILGDGTAQAAGPSAAILGDGSAQAAGSSAALDVDKLSAQPPGSPVPNRTAATSALPLFAGRPAADDGLTMPAAVASLYLSENYRGLHGGISSDDSDADTKSKSQASTDSATAKNPSTTSSKEPPPVKKGRGRPPGKTQKTLQRLAELEAAKEARKKSKEMAAASKNGTGKAKPVKIRLLKTTSKERLESAAEPGQFADASDGSTGLRSPSRPSDTPGGTSVASDGPSQPAITPKPSSPLALAKITAKPPVPPTLAAITIKPPASPAPPSTPRQKKKSQPHVTTPSSSSASKSDKKPLKKKKKKEKPPAPVPAIFAPSTAHDPIVSTMQPTAAKSTETADNRALVVPVGSLLSAKQEVADDSMLPGITAGAQEVTPSTPNVQASVAAIGTDSTPLSATSHGLKKKKKKKKHHRHSHGGSSHADASSADGSSRKKPSSSSKPSSGSSHGTGPARPELSTPVKTGGNSGKAEPSRPATPKKTPVSQSSSATTPKMPSEAASTSHTPDVKKSLKTPSKKKPTPMATPTAATPLATPKAATPLATPKAATPLATPKAATPLATPKAATPLAVDKGTPAVDPKKKNKKKRKHGDIVGEASKSSSSEPPTKKKKKKKPDASSRAQQQQQPSKASVASSVGHAEAAGPAAAMPALDPEDAQLPPKPRLAGVPPSTANSQASGAVLAPLPDPSVPTKSEQAVGNKAEKSSAKVKTTLSVAKLGRGIVLPPPEDDIHVPVVRLGSMSGGPRAGDTNTVSPPAPVVPGGASTADAAAAPAGAIPSADLPRAAMPAEKMYLCPICHKPDDGEVMITCDKCNNDVWYHINCVGLKAPPTDNEKWFCPPCKKKVDKKAKKKKKDSSHSSGSRNLAPIKVTLPSTAGKTSGGPTTGSAPKAAPSATTSTQPATF